MNSSFSEVVQHFFSRHLINYSKNTSEAYKYGILSLLKFFSINNIDVDSLLIEDIDINLIEEYIIWLKEDKKLSDSSINLKISALKSLMTYTKTKTLNGYDICTKINNIKNKRVKRDTVLEYLSSEETEILLSSIKVRNNNELKELAIISLLYDGAFRVQELCDLVFGDLDFSKKHLRISIRHGKGNKFRVISVSDNERDIIKEYIKTLDRNTSNDEYLFKNKYNNQYTRKGISYILKKYYKKCQENCNDKTLFKKNIHPHVLRHSKAMDLLDAGTSLDVIKEFLGHENYSTTRVYARYTTEQIENTILEHSKRIVSKNVRTPQEKVSLEEWVRKF